MKDIRLILLSDNRIGVFTRPQGKIGGRGRIGFMIVNSLKELGLDISENKIEQITEEVVRDAAKVVVMAEKDTLPDYITNNSKFIYWDIKDLKGLNQKDTNKIRDEISEKVKGLINELT